MGRVWQSITLPEGVEIKQNGGAPAVGIRFRYRGVRCRELSLSIQDPKQAKRYIATAADKLATIRLEIELGTFRYGNHFPDSPRCRIFGEGESKTRTLKQSLREWLDAAEEKYEAGDYQTYRRMVEHILIPRVGSKLVVSFSPLDAATLVTALAKEGRVGKTVRNIILPLRKAFDRELMARTIEANPVRQIAINEHLPVASRRHRTPLPQPFNQAEREAILAVADAQTANQCRAWWGTGMSEGEICGLQWSDLSFATDEILLTHVMESTGTLRDRMKTNNRHRKIRMSPEVKAAFTAQKKFTFIEGGYVFVNPVTGKQWASPRASERQWRTLLKRAGVAHRGPNQCRHTYAAIRITRGDNLFEIAEALGHRGIEMLNKHYGSIIREREEAAGQRRGTLAVK